MHCMHGGVSGRRLEFGSCETLNFLTFSGWERVLNCDVWRCPTRVVHTHFAQFFGKQKSSVKLLQHSNKSSYIYSADNLYILIVVTVSSSSIIIREQQSRRRWQQPEEDSRFSANDLPSIAIFSRQSWERVAVREVHWSPQWWMCLCRSGDVPSLFRKFLKLMVFRSNHRNNTTEGEKYHPGIWKHLWARLLYCLFS